MIERASDLEYLEWFRLNCDFGPAHSDVIESLDKEFMNTFNKNLPEGWNLSQDGKTPLDKPDIEHVENMLKLCNFKKWGWIHYHEPALLIYHYKELNKNYQDEPIIIAIINPKEETISLTISTTQVTVKDIMNTRILSDCRKNWIYYIIVLLENILKDKEELKEVLEEINT